MRRPLAAALVALVVLTPAAALAGRILGAADLTIGSSSARVVTMFDAAVWLESERSLRLTPHADGIGCEGICLRGSYPTFVLACDGHMPGVSAERAYWNLTGTCETSRDPQSLTVRASGYVRRNGQQFPVTLAGSWAP